MPQVSLTFDNGPTAGVTEEVLDRLQAHAVPATLFVIGAKAATAEGRSLVRRALECGHRVGGHTWTHSVPFGRLDDESVEREVDDTRALVRDLGGDERLFRPYGVGGVIDDRLMSTYGASLLRQGGFTCVAWTSVPGDWLDPEGWPERALVAVDAAAWSVVVLHDIPNAASAQLDTFLTQLRSREVAFSQDFPDECVPIRDGRPTSSYGLLGVGEPPGR